MTKSIDVDVALKGPEPLVHQHAPEIQAPSARVSFIAADGDHDAGRVDAVAGCEFVDDRIRLRE